MNWTTLGRELRTSAMDAHDGVLPPVELAYAFLLANPECFSQSEWLASAVNECVYEWPAEMPSEPNIELIAAYFEASALPTPENPQSLTEDAKGGQ